MKTDTFNAKSAIISATVIWLLLLGFTLLSVYLDDILVSIASPTSLAQGIIIGALAITVIKCWLVSDYYMEMRHAPGGWRSLMNLYALVIALISAVIYLSAL